MPLTLGNAPNYYTTPAKRNLVYKQAAYFNVLQLYHQLQTLKIIFQNSDRLKFTIFNMAKLLMVSTKSII